MSRLSELASIIAEGTEVLEKHYQEHGIAVPSFEANGPVDTVLADPAMERTRLTVLEASTEMKDLLEGPTMLLRPVLNATSLNAIYEYNIASHVPLDGNISYEDLGRLCGLDPSMTRRLVRFAISHHHIFQESREGYVSHSAASKLLADSLDAMAGVGAMFTVCYQGFASTVKALKQYPHQDPTHCGWALAHQSNVPIWQRNANDPKAAERGTRAMRQFTRGFGHDTTSLLQGFDWASLNEKHDQATVVDLGGSNGHASVLLAQHYPQLHFEVQDLPHIIDAAGDQVPSDLRQRVTLKAHDFTQPQPTQADVYLLRQILHDWPDAQCIEILRALIPALKPGARIVLNDFVVSAPGVVSPHIERHIRAMDMIVLTLAGAKERERSDWKALFAQADPRFVDIQFRQPEACCMAVIEATWSG